MHINIFTGDTQRRHFRSPGLAQAGVRGAVCFPRPRDTVGGGGPLELLSFRTPDVALVGDWACGGDGAVRRTLLSDATEKNDAQVS